MFARAALLGLVASIALAFVPPALAGPGLQAGTVGPFAGTVAQGETDPHVYDNNPSGVPCVQVAVAYTVVLTFAPGTDTLTLAAAGRTTTGSGGGLTLSFERGVCTAFEIDVTGTEVASKAVYVVTVAKGGPGSILETGA